MVNTNQPTQSLTPKRQDFRFAHSLRVRWSEVDMQKIVFNGHYLMYFDTAVADYWRALGLPYEEAMHQLGGDLYVRKASVEYFASARYEDLLEVALRCERVGTSSITFMGAIFSQGRLLVTGELIYVFANPQTQTSLPVPDPLRNIFTQYEAGKDLVSVQTGDWATCLADAKALRMEVFVTEQQVPAEIEIDEADPVSLHALAYNSLGQVLATGRLLPVVVGEAKVGRMAVKRVLRGSGLGAQILRTLIQASRDRGDQSLVLHAQTSAKGFYQRYGFIAEGEEFDEAGLPHQLMRLSLTSS
jgi:YbgC/YbaW family acyl-CoA thioester hydrolase